MTFSLMPTIWGAMIFIALSRVAMGTNSVFESNHSVDHVPDALRGRVFTSVGRAAELLDDDLGWARPAWLSVRYSPRQIGVPAGR